MSDVGHNSGDSVLDSEGAKRLKTFVERIERLAEEKDAIASDIRDIYSEAKGVGYDVKALRKMIARRKLDAAERAEQDALLELYEGAFS